MKVVGVTVHLVDEGVDTGPVLAQRAVELPFQTLTADEIREILRPVEHELLTAVVRAFAAGADEYVQKPFSTRELVLRAAALLARP